MKKSIPPGMGERIALRGYVPQTRYQIELIIDLLLKDQLIKVEFASIRSGKADDLILFSKRNVDFYQFKYQTRELSYSDFVGLRNPKGKLLSELCESWKLIRKNYVRETGNKKINVYFITNVDAQSGNNRNIPSNRGDNSEKGFKRFIDEVLIPLRKSKKVSSEWAPAYKKWQLAAGLSPKLFKEFQKSFSIRINREPRDKQTVNDKDAEFLYKHFHEKIFQSLNTDKIEISADELKELLGLQRFQLKNIHNLPLPDIYSPIKKTKARFVNSIKNVNQGYIALLGSPGSGKTSLITDINRSSPKNVRTISYYAHYQGDEPFKPPRGEITSFYHDLTRLIDKELNLKSSYLASEHDLDYLRRRLKEQLDIFVDDYKKKKIKTVIFIDGLDHIEREDELRIKQSFLGELPTPNQLKDGVVFIIGSQRLELNKLSPTIKASIEKEKDLRLIQIEPLSRQATVDVLRKSSIHDWLGYGCNDYVRNNRIRDIHRLTEGHPLSSVYLIQWIKNQKNWELKKPDTLIGVLQKRPELINSDYEELWKEIIGSKELNMIGFISEVARLQGALDFEWIRQWPEYKKENLFFQNNFKHFFKRSSNGKWQFFHSSFRLFLIKKSIETMGNEKEFDKEVHSKIAQRCLSAPETVSYKWNLIYHLAYSGQITKVFNIADEDFFKEQYLSFRPVDKIIADTAFCLNLAVENKQAVNMFRYLLLNHRYLHAYNTWQLNNFEEEFLDILHNNDIKYALFDRIEHQIDTVDGCKTYQEEEFRLKHLQLINFLYGIGEDIRASEIFNDINLEEWFDKEFLTIRDSGHIDRRKTELVNYWAYTALFFISSADVIKILKSLNWEFNTLKGKKRNNARSRLFFNTLIDVCERAISVQSESFKFILTYLEENYKKRESVPFWWVDLILSAISHSRGLNKQDYLQRLIKELSVERVRNALAKTDKKNKSEIIRQLCRIVSVLFDSNFELAIEYGKLLERKDVVGLCRESIDENWFNQMGNALFELEIMTSFLVVNGAWKVNDIFAILDDLKTDKSSTDENRWQAFRELAKARLILSHMRGLSLLNKNESKKYDQHTLWEHSRYILTHAWGKSNVSWEYRYFHNVSSQKENFRRLIKYVSSLGNKEVQGLKKLFNQIFDSKLDYPDEIKEVLIQHFQQLGFADLVKKCKSEVLKQKLPFEYTNTESIEECLRRARVCSNFQNHHKSIKFLKRALLFAFAENNEKDHQVVYLMEWIKFQLKGIRSKNLLENELLTLSKQALIANESGTSGAEASYVIFLYLYKLNSGVAFNYLNEFICKEIGWNCFDNTLNHLIQEIYEEYLNSKQKSIDRKTLLLFTALFNLYCLPQRHHLARETIDSARMIVSMAPLRGQISRVVIANKIIQATRSLLPNSDTRKRLFHEITSVIPKNERLKLIFCTDDLPQVEDPALKDGTEQPYPLRHRKKEYHQEEVVARIIQDSNSVRQFAEKEITNDEHKYQRFNWGNILDKVFPLLDKDSFNKVIETLIETGRASQDVLKYLNILYQRNQLNNLKLAEKAALDIINDQSEDVSRGWVRFFDGEHKILALSLLCKINFKKYSDLAFIKFRQALNGSMHIPGLVQNSVELLKLFSQNDFQEISKIVAGDREIMFSAFEQPKIEIKCIQSGQLVESKDVLMSLIKTILGQFSLTITYMVKRAYVELLWIYECYPREVLDVVRLILEESIDELKIERLLLFIEKIAGETNKKDLKCLKTAMERCCCFRNFSIVASSRKLLRYLGEGIPKNIEITSEPKIIIRSQNIITLNERDKDHLFTKYNFNPIFSTEVNILAEQLRKSKEEIIQKLHSIMYLDGNDSESLSKREDEIYRRFSWVRSSYIRQNALASKQALKRYLHYSQVRNWERYELPHWADKIFRGHDPYLISETPDVRPEWIKIIQLERYDFYKKEDAEVWVNNLESTKDLSNQTIDNKWVLLSEFSEFQFGSDLMNKEIRYFSIIASVLDTVKKQIDRNFWDTQQFIDYSDYLNGNVNEFQDDDINSLVIKTDSYRSLDGHISWFGLHPNYAVMLGLQCKQKFPPHWVDKKKRTACMTVYWKDGVWMHKHYSDSFPAGEGWYVLLRKDLYDKLQSLLKASFYKKVGIRRQCYDYRISQFNPIFEKTVI